MFRHQMYLSEIKHIYILYVLYCICVHYMCTLYVYCISVYIICVHYMCTLSVYIICVLVAEYLSSLKSSVQLFNIFGDDHIFIMSFIYYLIGPDY